MKFWAQRTSWLICGLLAAGFFPPQSSASGDGAPRTQASDVAQKHLLSFVGAPLPGHSTAQGTPSFYGPGQMFICSTTSVSYCTRTSRADKPN